MNQKVKEIFESTKLDLIQSDVKMMFAKLNTDETKIGCAIVIDERTSFDERHEKIALFTFCMNVSQTSISKKEKLELVHEYCKLTKMKYPASFVSEIMKLEPKNSEIVMFIGEAWIHSNETEECSEKTRVGECVIAFYKTKSGLLGSFIQKFSRAQQSIFFDNLQHNECTFEDIQNSPIVEILNRYNFEIENTTMSDIESLFSEAA